MVLSGQIATGKAYSHTFDTAGTYTYFCEIHPATMHGEITVR
jgi:plastocyanin